MVTQWGMSETLGPIHFPQQEQHPFLGMEMSLPKNFSDQTAHAIDKEVEKLVKSTELSTLSLLQEHRHQLDKLATELVDHETLSAAQVNDLLELI